MKINDFKSKIEFYEKMLQIHNEKLEKYEREMALSDENTKQTYLVN
jgi:hypothetical protein